LAFALSSALGGSGILLYVILWSVVPRAYTRADRMAMKGEKQNLQGFKKNFEEELHAVRNNLSNLGTEAKPFIYKMRDFFSDLFYHLGLFINGAGRFFVKLIGVFILLVCFSVAVALVVGFFAFVIFKEGRPVNFFPYEVIGNEHAENVFIATFVVAFIPVLSIILVTIKGIFNVGNIGRSTGIVFLTIWLCALGTLIFYASKIASGFRESASSTKTVNLKRTLNNTYYLKLNDIKYFTHDDSVRLEIKDHFSNMVVIDDNANSYHGEPRNVSIKIEKSDINQPLIEEWFGAKGRSEEDALVNVSNTSYVFTQQDSVLKFDYTVRKEHNISWHDEEVRITLKLPLNSTVVIDQRLDNYLPGFDLYQCAELNKEKRANFATYVMTDNGLQCKIDTVAVSKPDSAKAVKAADSVKIK